MQDDGGGSINISATNCVKLSGNGPRKVVFMRGKTWIDSSISGFVNQANLIIGGGFNSIESYKSYYNQFSFYVDLKKYDDSSITKDTNAMLYSTSSCNDFDGITDQWDVLEYVFLSSKKSNDGSDGWVYGFYGDNEKVTYIADLLGISNNRLVHIVMHEPGHIIGDLTEEIYKVRKRGTSFCTQKLCL